MEPIRLVTGTEPPCAIDEEVIEKLESLLADAKDGKFNGIAYITVTSPNIGEYIRAGSDWAGAGVYMSVHIALGAIQVLNQRMLNALIAFND